MSVLRVLEESICSLSVRIPFLRSYNRWCNYVIMGPFSDKHVKITRVTKKQKNLTKKCYGLRTMCS